MIIPIDTTILEKFQYGDLTEDDLSNASLSANTLVTDLINGSAAYYLLSGYRGAGKTSYIKRVKALIEKQSGKSIILVPVDFSRYKEKGNLFRWLIRELYLSIFHLPAFLKLESEERKKTQVEQTASLLRDLYLKTFHEIARSKVKSNKSMWHQEKIIDWVKWGTLIIACGALIFEVLNVQFEWVSQRIVNNLLTLALCGIAGVRAIFSFKEAKGRTSTDQDDYSSKTLFDDEIADHYFLTVLRSLRKNGFNILFTLDEMDKVEDDRLDGLMTEIKPYLLSGHASFIVVAGQNLYYKYRQSNTQDDSILSSIFSKCIHIGLLSRQGFHDLFARLLVTTDHAERERAVSPDKEILQGRYVDMLIYTSKRVPRKFINLIRDKLQWTDAGIATLYILDAEDELGLYGKLLDIISDIEESEIAAESFEVGERDYFVMQLFITCAFILQSGDVFNVDTFLQKEVNPGADNKKPIYQKFANRVREFTKRYVQLLLEGLEKDRLIEKAGSSYRLSKNMKVVESSVTSSPIEEIDHRRLMELRNIVNNICFDLAYVKPSDNYTFTQQLRILEARGACDDPFLNNNQVGTFLNKLDDLIRENAGNFLITKAVKDYSIPIGKITNQLLDFYCKNKADLALRNYGYRTDNQYDIAPFDYVLKTNEVFYQILFFQIKLRRGNPFRDRQLFLDLLRQFAQRQDGNSFLFLVFFLEGSGMGRETIKLQFQEIFEDISLPRDLRECVQFVPVDINELKSIDQGFKEFIDKNIERSIRRIFSEQPAPPNHQERNDDELDELLEFKKYNITINIVPDNTKFWRFGLRFLPREEIPRRNQGRHSDSQVADITICVGDSVKDVGGIHHWSNPNHLALSLHHISSIGADLSNPGPYQKGAIAVHISSGKDGSKSTILVRWGDSYTVEQEFDLRSYRYCRLAAWCEDSSFKLVTEIKITRKPA